jgi:hypothetical protein
MAKLARDVTAHGMGRLDLSTSKTSTGATPWLDLNGSYTKFAMQVIRLTTGTTAFTVVLQGTLSTATTNPRQLISYTRATDNSIVKFSTAAGIPPCSKVRAVVSVLGGTSGAAGFGVRIYAAAVA